MLDAIIEILNVMGWLGIVFAILVITNTIAGAISNIWSGEEAFSWKRLFQGLLKAFVFYLAAIFISIAFTIIPFINEMITTSFGVMLFSNETLNTLSGIGVLGVVVAAIIVQGKKAIENIIKLANTSSNTEQITWNVVEEEDEKEEK